MILDFPTMPNKALIQNNYELAKELYEVVLKYFDATREQDIKWFECAQSRLYIATTEMINSL